MIDLEAALDRAAADWLAKGLPSPTVAIVAGSGLSVRLGEGRQGPFPLESLLPFPVHAIEGHPLAYEVFESEAGAVLYFRGRLHAYQGFSAAEVTFGVRLARLLGARALIVTNASGGIYHGARPGDLVAITDHINLTGLNPLVGRLPAAWGPQFPDLMDAYDPVLRDAASREARELGIDLRSGVYVGVLGPSYETPAEIEAFRRLGGDLIGMSTVLEVIAARHMGLRCCGISLVTNPAAGTQPAGEPLLDHEDVLDVGRQAARNVERLLGALLSSPELSSPA